jgi:CubicO group peptidase (beta-lactamase class C family)
MVLGMWKRTLLVLVPLVALVGACTSDVDTPSDDSVIEGAVGAGASCEAVDEALGAWAEAGFSGSVAITKPGEDECLLAYGDVEPDTVFAIGSITKAVTAVSVLQLVDEGELSLDDRVGDLVPGLSGPVADATVEQLLLHTSGITGGIGDDLDPLTKEQAITNLSGLEQSFAPGTDYEYSNAGYSLLGIVVEEVSGEPYRERTLTAVPEGAGFWEGEPAPEGPRAVGTLEDGTTGSDGSNPGPYWAVDGNGSVAMTVPQLADWTRSLFEGELLSPESTELVANPGFDHGDGTGETPGWVVFDEDSPFGEPFIGTAGGGGDVGQDAITVWVPEQELVVSMASNQQEITSEQLLERVGAALLAGEPLPQPVAPAGDVEEGDFDALVGTYELPTGGRFDVAVDDGDEGDRLAVAARGADAFDALFPLPDDVDADEVTDHEAAVEALLAGETEAGREEVEALEGDLGTIESVEVIGTVDEGELRTYVSIDAELGTTLAWYALSDQGGIEAVELTEVPPTQVLVPTDDGTFRIDDPTGGGPELVARFEDGTMFVEAADGEPVVAEAAG